MDGVALFFGILQGLTEFLPVSSTGHLILAHALFGTIESDSLAFDATLHFATALAVVVYFRRDVWALLQTLLRVAGRLPVDTREKTLLIAIATATVPAALLGLVLEDLMGTLFRSPLLVAAVLVVGSIFFMYGEWRYQKYTPTNHLSAKKGFYIGLFQSLALLPGMSRSGSSIVGGMLLGLSRAEAARFSFLIAIPLILGAGAKKVLELVSSSDPVSWAPIIVGAGSAFVVGLAAIHFMLGFVRRHTLWPFIWYRLVLALSVVAVVFLA